MEKNTQEFRVLVRREPGYEPRFTVRFEMFEGHGLLSLGRTSSGEAKASAVGENTEVHVDNLRGGRFIRVMTGGRRHSYSLARLAPDLMAQLPDDRWTELTAVTEYGFRYLVLPDGAQVEDSSAQISISDPPGTPLPAPVRPNPTLIAAASKVARPPTPMRAPSRTPPPEPAPTSSLPPRQMPVDPAIGEKGLTSMGLSEAIARLRAEMAKVSALHTHIDELERRLAESRTREQDLLDVLSRWQERG